MSMSTYVIGYMEPDATFRKHKAVHDACIEADVSIPEETEEFFDGNRPTDNGLEINLTRHECVSPIDGYANNGFVIDISKVPEGVHKVSVQNSY